MTPSTEPNLTDLASAYGILLRDEPGNEPPDPASLPFPAAWQTPEIALAIASGDLKVEQSRTLKNGSQRPYTVVVNGRSVPLPHLIPASPAGLAVLAPKLETVYRAVSDLVSKRMAASLKVKATRSSNRLARAATAAAKRFFGPDPSPEKVAAVLERLKGL